jgi:trk system potassium uptake protein TrkH
VYFLLLVKKFKSVLKSEELRVFFILCISATAIISINTLTSMPGLDMGKAIRDAFFQVASIISTSGFATTNYDLWPSLSKALLVLLTVTGACAGSTAGGMKLSRVILVIKNIFRSIKQAVRPKSVNLVRLDRETVPDTTLQSASSYVSIYFAALIMCVLLISIDGFDFETNVTAALTCLSNVGPGLGAVGPSGNFADFSILSKLALSAVMLIGRLEFIPVLIIFSPTTWKKH